MINCKRCGVTLYIGGKSHDIKKCNTIPNHVWCPMCNELFPQRNPCKHYVSYGYIPGQNEEFIINLIAQNYSKGDWFTRRNKFRKSGDSMKKSTCTKCNTPVHNMSKKQQILHENIHLDENAQNSISKFF